MTILQNEMRYGTDRRGGYLLIYGGQVLRMEFI